MTDDSLDADPWVIPLHGAILPASSADAGTAPPVLGVLGPGAEVTPTRPRPVPTADAAPGSPLPFTGCEEELPAEGFHPRLRRSA